MKKKVAFVCPDAFSIWIFRQGLARALMARGYDVYAVTCNDRYVSKLEQIGIRFIPVNFKRFMSIREDLKLLFQLWSIFRGEHFDIVHNFTIKANIYGAFSALIAGVPVVYNSLTGLGYLYREEWEIGWKSTIIKKIVAILYALASKIALRTWFQNSDDVDYFIERKLIHTEKAIMIKSSGVDVDTWNSSNFSEESILSIRQQIGCCKDTIIIIMVSRALKAKGVYEFLDAADLLNDRRINTCFLLVGGTEDSGHHGATADALNSIMNRKGGNFIWLGHRHDVPILLAASDICVLPSYYREGVPRNLLEGMAIGKPIVTTDSVGCKETVIDGWNGYLVPARNSKALSVALEKLCVNPELRLKMGRNSRLKVEKEFDEKIVVDQLLKKLYRLPDFIQPDASSEKKLSDILQ